MIACPSCKRAAADDSRFCSSCGTRLPASAEAPTLTDQPPPGGIAGLPPGAPPGLPPGAPAGPPAGTPASGSGPRGGITNAAWLSSDSALDARFAPGVVFAGRYRIIGRIGKGGMGEVVRADDLRLGQPVALKFLPAEVAGKPERLARFLSEVRIARQVSHPNVCRVYDADHSEGVHYLSMEYIDGEDLASLLRRIGRLPKDKALETARQICAGLAAIHERGVLHRDLKPANVMLDGRGVARITDFGLAEVAAEDGSAAGRAGTPAYMAPEQLAGREATARTDVYALGLVLYELFTGKPAFTGKTIDQLMVAQLRAAPRPPGELVADLDPAVEAVLLRCLEKDPLKRPPSALAVSMALPGGDPLKAALLAGETPSPELVAAAGSEGALRPGVAGALLAVLALVLVGLCLTASTTRLLDVARVEVPPQVLQDRVQSTLRTLGYTERPVDTAWFFAPNQDYLRYTRRVDTTPARWDSLPAHRPAAVLFAYRQSPRHLAPENLLGAVRFDDPPHTVPGSLKLLADPRGRVLLLSVVPPTRSDSARARADTAELDTDAAGRAQLLSATPLDWTRGFAAAGLAPQDFSPATPAFTPDVFCDARAAWGGTYPGRVDLPIRVEMGAFQGRINWLRIVEPWDADADSPAPRRGRAEQLGNTLTIVMIAVCLFSAVLLARRHIRQGRGDRRGAARVAWAVFGMFLVELTLQAHHVPSLLRGWNRLQVSCGLALFVGGFLYVLYLGLEPYIRKLWPQTLISWSRLVAGRWRDPQVGRDVLVGLTLGAALALLPPILAGITRRAGHAPPLPLAPDPMVLSGLGGAIANALSVAINSLWPPLAVLLFILLLKVMLRRHAVAIAGAGLIFMTVGALGQDTLPRAGGGALEMAVLLVLLLRLGVVSVMAYSFAHTLLTNAPLTSRLDAWYAPMGFLAMALVAAMAVLAFRTSLAGRTLLTQPAPARSDRAPS